MMEIGVSGFAWTSDFSAKHFGVLPAVREHGITAFEIGMFDPAKLRVNELRRAFEENDLALSLCAILPAGINPISPEAEVRRRSLDHLVRCVETAAALGAKTVGGPVYAPIGYLPGRRRTEAEWGWAVECFQALGPHLEAAEVTLCLEPVNRGETFFLTTLAEARALCEAVGDPRLGITIDTFHANIEEKNLAAAVLHAGRFLKHVHASENDRGVPGSGHVDFRGLVGALEQIGYDGCLMIEGMGNSPAESGETLSLWKDQDASPMQIATGGYDYLSGLLAKG